MNAVVYCTSESPNTPARSGRCSSSGKRFPGPRMPISCARPRCNLRGDLVVMTKGLGMEEVITAPRSPWQNPYVERLIGSVRRECLDHVIVWNERSLRRTLKRYFAYYQRPRTHLALAKDAPESRVVEKPERGRVILRKRSGDRSRSSYVVDNASELRPETCPAKSHAAKD